MALTSTGDDDCPRCPPAQNHHQEICALGAHAQDCENLEDYDYDGRTQQVKVKDSPNDLPLTIEVSLSGFADRQITSCALPRPDPRRYPAGPALNLQYCVFLK